MAFHKAYIYLQIIDNILRKLQNLYCNYSISVLILISILIAVLANNICRQHNRDVVFEGTKFLLPDCFHCFPNKLKKSSR